MGRWKLIWMLERGFETPFVGMTGWDSILTFSIFQAWAGIALAYATGIYGGLGPPDRSA
jgi:hypothetical protein